MTTTGSSRSTAGRGHPAHQAITVLCRVLAAGLLVATGYIHLQLSSRYAPNRTSVLSERELFLAQGVLSFVVAAALLAWGRAPAAVAGLLLGAGSLGAVLLYRYVNVGRIGLLPNMYDPGWYPKKTLSAYCDAGVALTSTALLLARWRFARWPSR
ncbi:MAG: hypothetical protein ACYDB7_05700 [Mycobacteriales bacterium]